MQSAMQPFRASDRAAFCTAFGSFGHAPLRIEASHRQAAHILMAWRGVAWHGMAWHGRLSGWLGLRRGMHAVRLRYLHFSIPPQVACRLNRGARHPSQESSTQTADRHAHPQPSKVKVKKKCVGLSAGRRDSSARARSPARPQLSIPERAPLSLSPNWQAGSQSKRRCRLRRPSRAADAVS